MTIQRKLCAILFADAVGYSRLMANDESGTLRALHDARDVFRQWVIANHGRVVDTAGDSVLAVFASPVEAVTCAAAIQQDLIGRNTDVPDSQRMQFRIGINLGDVLEDEKAVYGDGVNVAARLQELAQPGSLCVSGTVFDQVEGKLPFSFRFLGEKTGKNLARPTRVYALASAEEASAATLAMPSGPALAVLPFTNMSTDAGDEYFADGITEDIITELARFRELHVLARNTTFQYKGQAVDVPALGRKLGVHYVLEGSVRRSGTRVRINAQLIEVASGAHRWAERIDRELTDIFAVQDEITAKIVGAIAGGFSGALQSDWRRLSQRKRPTDLTAYDLVLRATGVFAFDGQTYAQAKTWLEQAIGRDPTYARARHEYAWLLLLGWIFRLEAGARPSDEVKRNAIESVVLDPSDALAHRTAAYGYFFDHQLDPFEREARIALDLAPYNAEVFAHLGMAITFTGQWERGIALADKAFALNQAAAGGWYHTAHHYNFYRLRDYRKALEACAQHPYQSLIETRWKYIPVYGQLGQKAKAQEYFESCLSDDPSFSAKWVEQTLRLWNFEELYVAEYMDGFRKAGFAAS